MAVFDNIKNFIRHGKQAHTMSTPQQQTQTSLPGNGTLDAKEPPSPQLNSTIAQPVVTASTAKGQTVAPTSSGSPAINANATSASGSKSEPKSATKTEAKKKEYDEAIQKIVEQERLATDKPAQYPGLEDFTLVEKMGDGAFSVVYRAFNHKDNEHVAVKVISKRSLSSSQKSSILKEAAIMRQLNHKNITRLISFKETPDHYFIILELAPGGELFHQIVKLTYFSEDLSRHVILQVAEAIRYLHEVAGVVHRDIKPENLLFYPTEFIPSKKKVTRKSDDDTKEDEGEFIPGVGGGGIGVIKLADFGLSKIIWDKKTMTPCGTVGYTAPEIVKDERYSKSVDMWALGCVLYTILCGFPPFYDESIEALTEKVARGQYSFLSPWWDEISPAAKDLVSHLLTVDPEKRYDIDQFLQHPWIQVAKQDTSVSTSDTVQPSAQPRSYSKDFRSPAILKEVFDVSNAVHRMEEENYRRRMGAPGVLLEVQEEEDYDGASGVELVQQGLANVSMNKKQFFELDLDSSALLVKRNKRSQGANAVVA